MYGNQSGSGRRRSALSRRRLLRRVAGGGLGLAAATVLACGGESTKEGSPEAKATSATGSPAASAARAPSGKVVAGIAGAVDFLDAHICSQGGGCSNFQGDIQESLFGRDPQQKVVSRLASRFEASPDGLTWRFTLNPNAKFHNGDPVTAQDVKWSMERILDPTFNYWNINNIKIIERVETPDDATAIFRLSGPQPLLASIIPAITPRKYIETAGVEEYRKKPVAAGAFRVTKVDLRQSLETEAFTDYHDGPPAIKTVVWREIPDNNTRVTVLKTGEVDWIRDVPPQNVADLKRSNLKVVSNPTATALFIHFNTTVKPFDDVRVRQALYHATDRDAIIKNVAFNGIAGVPVKGFLPESVTGPDPELRPYEFSPQKARELLSAAGYANGFETTLINPIGRYIIGQEVLEAIAQMWAVVGVKAKVEGMDYALWGRQRTSHQMVHPTASQYATSFFDGFVSTTGQYTKGAGYSDYGPNAELDDVLKKSQTIIDQESRQALWRQVNRILMKDAASIWLFEQVQNLGMKPSVNFVPTIGAETPMSFRYSSVGS